MINLPKSKDDFKQVAALHLSQIPGGFLSTLGPGFLAALYTGINAHPKSRLLVYRNKSGRVSGFIAGTLSTPLCYKHVLSHQFFSLMPFCLSPAVWKRVGETLLYPFRRSVSDKDSVAEVLAIAVAPSEHHKGIGRQLISAFDAFLAEVGYHDAYKVVTNASDKNSNAFYLKTSFILRRTFNHHGNPMNEYTKKSGGR